MTRDIDADWIGEPTSMRILHRYISLALSKINPILSCEIGRNYGDGKSAGFIIYKQGVKWFTMDIDMRQNPYSTVYTTVNGINFNGASLHKMFADKIQAISTQKIFRRAKDVYDLYLLSAVQGYSTYDTYLIWKSLNRQPEDFSCFINRLVDLEYAYNKIRDIKIKPDFNIIYPKVYHFAEPFILKVQNNLIWDGNNWL